jgi:hypothetical protein
MSQDQRTPELQRTSEVTKVGSSSAEPRRFELSLSKIIAGALAAASAAVASSWLGVAGTVVGAVVGSIVVPVGTALYSHPLERSSQVIREALPPLPLLSERERSGAGPDPVEDDGADAVPGSAPGAAVPAGQVSPSSAERRNDAPVASARRPFRWGMLAVSCLVTLVVAFGLLTAAESVMGRSFSSLLKGGHGGTTVSRLVHHNGGSGTTKPSGPSTSTPTTGAGTTAPTTSAPTTEPTTTAPLTTAPTTTAPATDPGATTPTTGGDATTGGQAGGELPTDGQVTGSLTPTPAL